MSTSSTRFIKHPGAWAAVLLAAFAAGCSAPMPAPAPPPPPPEEVKAAAPAGGETAAEAAPPSETELQFQRALAALNAKQDAQAEALFSTLAQNHPELASPHANLGIIYFRRGALEQAEEAFKQAVERHKQDFVAHNYLGIIYRTQGKFDEARQAYEQALAANAGYAYAHLNLAILYDLYLGELELALQHYQRYQQLQGGDDPQLSGWLADLQQRINSRQEPERGTP